MKNYLLAISIILSLASASYAQNLSWPTANPNQQSQITGTVGEYREDNNYRWHAGVDISPLIEVHAMNGGTATWNGIEGSLTVISILDEQGETIEYIHVSPNTTIIENYELGLTTTVAAGDNIGTTYDMNGRHLHLELGNASGGDLNANFLLSRLTPYVDNSRPVYRSNTIDDGIEFYKNGLNAATGNPNALKMGETVEINGVTHTIIYDKIDIVTDVVDRWTASNGSSAGTGQLAPFGFEWSLSIGEEILYEDDLEFDRFPNNMNAQNGFHPNSSSPGNPSLYILTIDPYNSNQDIRNRWWNTRLIQNGEEDWSTVPNRSEELDAFINAQSNLKDDTYDFTLDAYDVDYAANPNNRLADVIEKNVIIDNFKPYIQRFEIAVSTDGNSYSNIYTGEWIPHSEYFNGELRDRWIEFEASGDPTIAPSDFVEFRIIASEPLKWTNPTVEPTILIDGVSSPPSLVSVNDSKEFVFVMPSGNFDLSGLDNGTKTITINGYDLASNQITGFDQLDNSLTDEELPHRLGDTQWSGTLVSKTDTRHVLHVGGSSCAPPGGRVASSICPLIADFNHAPDFNNPRTVNFTDRSTPSEEITAWYWDFGDGATSSSQHPSHAYQFVGEYPVTLTVNRGQEQDSWTAFINVTSEPLVADFTMLPSSGSAPLNVSLNSSNSQGNIQDWEWQISPMTGVQYVIGNSTSENPSIRITASGNYTVSLTVDNGISSHTSDDQIINVTPGNVGETTTDFYWEGQAYAGSQIQFFDNSFIQCIGGSPTYKWNIYEFSSTRLDVGGNLPDPYLTFLEEGNAEVELCIEDGCGNTICSDRKIVEVVSGTQANKDLFAQFYINGSTVLEKGESIEIIDQSYGINGASIDYWNYFFEVPFGEDIDPVEDSQPGPNAFYQVELDPPFNNPKTHPPNHTYNNAGKYIVRSWARSDPNSLAYNYWDVIVLVKRSESFCNSENTISESQTYVDGDDELLIAGILEIYDQFAEAEFIVESGAELDLVGRSVNLKTDDGNWSPSRDRERIHFQQGSRVHLRSADCDELRITFDD